MDDRTNDRTESATPSSIDGAPVDQAAAGVPEGYATAHAAEQNRLLRALPLWYLLAHDHLRSAARAFRLDRFVRVERAPETFRPDARAISPRHCSRRPGSRSCGPERV